MSKAAVLLSGGIDSTTVLYMAAKEHGAANVLGLSLTYGQRHRKEIEYADRSCEVLGVLRKVVDIGSIIPSTMLTDESREVPSISYKDIVGTSPTYVPYRNGLLLSAAASIFHGGLLNGEFGDVSSVEDSGEHILYYGAHAEDAQGWAYPDCSPEFNGAMANAIYIGTYSQARLHTPLQWLTKADIIRKGQELGVWWSNTWSCYKGGEMHCGECPTCRARRAGFELAGVADPTHYAA